MFKNTMLVTTLALSVAGLSFAQAETAPISGTVQSRCSIQTDTVGVYGNPNAYTLSTDPANGGVEPVIRFDVSLAGAYKALISYPLEFSSSPSLPDVPTFTGGTYVKRVSDASGMGTYETDKVEFANSSEYDLTATGSTWFATSSSVTMGGNKALPGGTYTALVEAQCIAK